MIKRSLFALLTVGSLQVGADVVLDLNALYLTDSFSYTTDSTVNRTIYDFMVGASLNKRGNWVLGWNYASLAFKDNPGTETSLAVTDMGPRLVYYIDRGKTYSIGATYNLITKAKYSAGATPETELRGTSMRMEFGFTPIITEKFYMGGKFHYYTATFNEEITNGTALEEVSFKRAFIYPSLSMTYRFD